MEASSKQFRKRNAILSCLQQSESHPSAEALYQDLRQEHPDISLATVYRNLALFRNQGVIRSLGTVGGVERFDGDICPHAHFACSSCGVVVDLPEAGVPDCGGIAREMGCRVEEVQMILTGLCKDCLSHENK